MYRHCFILFSALGLYFVFFFLFFVFSFFRCCCCYCFAMDECLFFKQCKHAKQTNKQTMIQPTPTTTMLTITTTRIGCILIVFYIIYIYIYTHICVFVQCLNFALSLVITNRLLLFIIVWYCFLFVVMLVLLHCSY